MYATFPLRLCKELKGLVWQDPVRHQICHREIKALIRSSALFRKEMSKYLKTLYKMDILVGLHQRSVGTFFVTFSELVSDLRTNIGMHTRN